jgi:hypothetical protein
MPISLTDDNHGRAEPLNSSKAGTFLEQVAAGLQHCGHAPPE